MFFRWLFQLFLYLKQESRITVGFASRMRWVVLFFPGGSTIFLEVLKHPVDASELRLQTTCSTSDIRSIASDNGRSAGFQKHQKSQSMGPMGLESQTFLKEPFRPNLKGSIVFFEDQN